MVIKNGDIWRALTRKGVDCIHHSTHPDVGARFAQLTIPPPRVSAIPAQHRALTDMTRPSPSIAYIRGAGEVVGAEGRLLFQKTQTWPAVSPAAVSSCICRDCSPLSMHGGAEYSGRQRGNRWTCSVDLMPCSHPSPSLASLLYAADLRSDSSYVCYSILSPNPAVVATSLPAPVHSFIETRCLRRCGEIPQCRTTIYVFAIMYGAFAGGYTATWPGITLAIRERCRDENGVSRVDTGMVVALFAAGKGIGSVVSGPLSEVLLEADGWQGKAGGAFGTGYGSLVVWSGVTMFLGGISWFAKKLGRI
ncbi:hypothetical protein P171DRAFT_122139 [Karstenula rhodostoma CBS 690.94]|uniref:MFS general substrate transporter n=1 Tax=Karstenula rhodostoma CBS 690.94 TaxID=1392251 RepID=A0A9P4P6Q9_9PLEO|nr:hypothetical protein P171DRAFT_122139 [Karstenula rhodostoma CBS 690.94]